MPLLEFDVGDPKQAARFPRHGWATNSQGLKLLWMPILTLFRNVGDVRRHSGATLQVPERQTEQAHYFWETLDKLCVTLSELHKWMHTTQNIGIDAEGDLWQADREASKLIPLYIDLGY